jgi:glucose/arabinose dehydrogenase
MDLPTGGHSTRNVLFNRAGTKMYVAVGRTRTTTPARMPSCRDPRVQSRWLGLPRVCVRASATRSASRGSRDDTLWTAMNERDNLGDDLVPDYATSVKDGGFYGWPYSYIGKNYDPRYQGAFPDLVNRAIVPDVLHPGALRRARDHLLRRHQFPQRFRNGGYRRTARLLEPVGGQRLQGGVLPDEQRPPGPIEDFVSGMLASNGEGGSAIDAWGRPVGVTVRPRRLTAGVGRRVERDLGR